MTREQWKKHYRLLRIYRRETYKACWDAIMYGVGFTKVGAEVEDWIKHIPAQEVYINANDTDNSAPTI